MNDVKEYLSRTKSAVSKLFESYNSYWELFETPERPVFTFWGDFGSEENQIAYEKWTKENSPIFEERLKKDN